MKKHSGENKNASNVIDMTERINTPDPYARFRNLKVRFDMEHAKVAVSTSLLSVVLLVTLANNGLWAKSQTETQMPGGRGIASVPTGTSVEEDSMVQRLAKTELGDRSAIGRKPSSLEALTLGELEGKYAVRLQDGKIRELEFSDATAQGDRPKHVNDLAAFLEGHRELLPVDFDKTVKVESASDASGSTEIYQLVNKVSVPMARVEFGMDSAGRLLSMRVSQMHIASK